MNWHLLWRILIRPVLAVATAVTVVAVIWKAAGP